MPRRSRSSSRSSRRSRSRSLSSEVEGVRVHVGELPVGCSEKELEHIFKKFGPLVEVWMAKVPPCFAFIVFRDREDAEEAIRAMNNRTVCGRRVRVSIARPRVEARGNRRTAYTGDSRCYQCGERGHLSRDCNSSRSHRPTTSRRHRRSSSVEKSCSRSRSRSRSRGKKSRRNDKSRERSHGKESSERRTDEKYEKQSSSRREGKDRDDEETRTVEKDKSDKRKAEMSHMDDKGEIRKISIVSDRAVSAENSP